MDSLLYLHLLALLSFLSQGDQTLCFAAIDMSLCSFRISLCGC
jgi:hypothetical protein